MSKHYELFDHTADVGLSATADTLGELFEALAECLADFICPRAAVQPRERRDVTIEAEDVEALAVDFLAAVLNVIQTDRFMIASVRVSAISSGCVAAELTGEPYDAARHEIHTEVKAVTYHMLCVARREGRWNGQVVLDL